MPMSSAFENRLLPRLDDIAEHFGTPFHIYDEKGLRATGERLRQAFDGVPGFQEYFAVKALPNPRILALMRAMGFGFDCSSEAELELAARIGAAGPEMMFTSNNTSAAEFAAAERHGAILNLDDLSLVSKVPRMPELVCFRYNPGAARDGNPIIGTPVEAKYGVTHLQLPEAYRRARAAGARRFGLHTMLVSNELDHRYMVETVEMLLAQVARLEREVEIRCEFINMGGGIGIPYRPTDPEFQLARMGREITARLDGFLRCNGWVPRLAMESGRYMTGPHGVLVGRAITIKETYRRFVGLDACMSSLMRPAIYGAYHHISVAGKPADGPLETVDVVGSLCENNDKFAVQRPLPAISEGDLVIIHDTGAHGHAMGFNYNGRLRPAELLLAADGGVELIRRAETLQDHFATLDFTPRRLAP